jgi:hypothetical protein
MLVHDFTYLLVGNTKARLLLLGCDRLCMDDAQETGRRNPMLVHDFTYLLVGNTKAGSNTVTARPGSVVFGAGLTLR